MARKAKPLQEIAYDLAYGSDSAAQPGMVMFRISVEGNIMRELNMPPDEFMQLAHAFEIVARAVDADMQKQQ